MNRDRLNRSGGFTLPELLLASAGTIVLMLAAVHVTHMMARASVHQTHAFLVENTRNIIRAQMDCQSTVTQLTQSGVCNSPTNQYIAVYDHFQNTLIAACAPNSGCRPTQFGDYQLYAYCNSATGPNSYVIQYKQTTKIRNALLPEGSGTLQTLFQVPPSCNYVSCQMTAQTPTSQQPTNVFQLGQEVDVVPKIQTTLPSSQVGVILWLAHYQNNLGLFYDWTQLNYMNIAPASIEFSNFNTQERLPNMVDGNYRATFRFTGFSRNLAANQYAFLDAGSYDFAFTVYKANSDGTNSEYLADCPGVMHVQVNPIGCSGNVNLPVVGGTTHADILGYPTGMSLPTVAADGSRSCPAVNVPPPGDGWCPPGGQPSGGNCSTPQTPLLSYGPQNPDGTCPNGGKLVTGGSVQQPLPGQECEYIAGCCLNRPDSQIYGICDSDVTGPASLNSVQWSAATWGASNSPPTLTSSWYDSGGVGHPVSTTASGNASAGTYTPSSPVSLGFQNGTFLNGPPPGLRFDLTAPRGPVQANVNLNWTLNTVGILSYGKGLINSGTNGFPPATYHSLAETNPFGAPGTRSIDSSSAMYGCLYQATPPGVPVEQLNISFKLQPWTVACYPPGTPGHPTAYNECQPAVNSGDGRTMTAAGPRCSCFSGPDAPPWTADLQITVTGTSGNALYYTTDNHIYTGASDTFRVALDSGGGSSQHRDVNMQAIDPMSNAWPVFGQVTLANGGRRTFSNIGLGAFVELFSANRQHNNPTTCPSNPWGGSDGNCDGISAKDVHGICQGCYSYRDSVVYDSSDSCVPDASGHCGPTNTSLLDPFMNPIPNTKGGWGFQHVMSPYGYAPCTICGNFGGSWGSCTNLGD